MKPSARTGGDGPGWLPHPVLSLVLALVWLLLQQSLAPAHLLSAAVLALGLPWLLHGFIGDSVHPRSPRAVLHLAGVVLWDIVMSNITVARLVLNPASDPKPAWVDVPLEAEHPTAITLLAAIITMTPGTVSCVIDERRHSILVHALDCSDAAAMAAQIKQRYERPLRRIFDGVDT
jgi:multicomponent K+:H+ antiporter subunit E